jgi:SAM-dependent methyltransferase
MKTKLLKILCCPHCKGEFQLSETESSHGEVRTGILVCEPCEREYKIQNYIPRIFESSCDEPVTRTVQNFGEQWTRFNEMHDTYREQFLDWVYPLTEQDFKGKIVLDAGCGMGRLLNFAAKFGASEAIGIDLSSAVDTAYPALMHMPNVHVVQCDILKPPFSKSFDLFYSIGVLHHMPDPEAGFKSLCNLLRPGGIANAWVYGHEGNEWLVRHVNPIRESVTSRLPPRALYILSLFVNIALFPILKLLYLPAGRFKLMRHLLPYFPYMHWLSTKNFRHNHQVIYDHLNPQIAHYIRHDDFQRWFERAGLSDITVTHRNANSWRGTGKLK